MARKAASVDGVEIYYSPWVPGTRAVGYFGPIAVSLFLPYPVDDTEGGIDQLLQLLKEKAVGLDKDANYVVGVDVSVDPFQRKDGKEGLLLWADGTVAKLEPLF